jgi:hypothetical protein
VKHIKTYESVWEKNIKVGEIYKIPSFLIVNKGYLSNISICRILNRTEHGYFNVKTFIKSTGEECVKELYKKFILKKATPEEIKEFEAFEVLNMFNQLYENK